MRHYYGKELIFDSEDKSTGEYFIRGRLIMKWLNGEKVSNDVDVWAEHDKQEGYE